MAELRNTFSWSFSQAKDFAACPRRYYWQRYGSWGGWEDLAPKGVKLAYRLKQMKNSFAIVGIAVEKETLHYTTNQAVIAAFYDNRPTDQPTN